MRRQYSSLCVTLAVLVLSGCSYLPGSGFTRSDVEPSSKRTSLDGIQVVDVTDALARQLVAKRTTKLFSEALGTSDAEAQKVGAGDTVEIAIWEAPPASLFGSGILDPRAGPTTTKGMTLPEQVVNNDGTINVPFVGQVKVAGRTLQQIEADIAQKLKGKANQPQVMVRVVRNASSNVTVVGDVGNSIRVPLTPRGERVLDALAAAGGVRQPVNKMAIQVTRGNAFHSLPLETIIRDPRQNVPLQPGDVVTALFQPLSLTALGATGKNEEINFEAQGISLAQALARSGGLIDSRADAKGIFIFRLEPTDAITWPKQPVTTTPEGKVAVIYRIDLDDPASFFVAQSFQMQNKDLLYISNAPAAELQKFLNLLFSIYYPLVNASSIAK